MRDNVLTKRELAARLLTGMFTENRRIRIADAVEAARTDGISRKLLTAVRKDLGAVEVHNGPYPAFWELPEAPPASQRSHGTHEQTADRGPDLPHPARQEAS